MCVIVPTICLTFIFSDVVSFSSCTKGFLPTLEGRLFEDFIGQDLTHAQLSEKSPQKSRV